MLGAACTVAAAQIPAHAPAFPGPPPGVPGLGAGLPPVAPIPPFGTHNPFGGGFFGRPRALPRGHGHYAPIYGYPMFTGYAPLSQPGVIIVNNVSPEVESRPVPAPDPAKPVLREYDWSGHKEATGAPAEPAAWAIVLNDGAAAQATMLWVQDGRLFYLDPEGRQASVLLESVDRRRTAEANMLRGVLRY